MSGRRGRGVQTFLERATTMKSIETLELQLANLELTIRHIQLIEVLSSEPRTNGCTGGCTGACPDPTGNCTHSCTDGCTNGCTRGCARKILPAEDVISPDPAAPLSDTPAPKTMRRRPARRGQ